MKKLIWRLIFITATIIVLANYSCSPTSPEKEPWILINLPDQRLTTSVGQGVILSIEGQASNVERMQILIDQKIVNDFPMSIASNNFEVFVSDFGTQGIKDVVVRVINRKGMKDYSFKIENSIEKLRDLAYNSLIEYWIVGGRITRFLNLSDGPYAHPVRVRVPPWAHSSIKGIEEGMNFWKKYAGIDYEIQAIDFDPPENCYSKDVEGYVYIYLNDKFGDSACGYSDYHRYEMTGGGICLFSTFNKEDIKSQASTIAHEMGHLLGMGDTHDYTIMDYAGTFYLYPYQIYAIQLVYQKNPGDSW